MTNNKFIRSPLKWAGCKFKSLPTILETLPNGKRLVEPFAGSGTVFLNTDYDEYLIADNNRDIILLFILMKNMPHKLMVETKKLFDDNGNDKEVYHRNRDEFNKLNDEFDKLLDLRYDTDLLMKRAALFLYLNRHCFNGLCRYNSKDEFNVSFGQYTNPYFPEKEIIAFHEKAIKTNVEFVCDDFVMTLCRTEPGDVVYCDPPYIPISQTSNFTKYSKNDFNLSDQQLLAGFVKTRAYDGIPVLISNSDTPLTRELYNTDLSSEECQVPSHVHTRISATWKTLDVQRNIAGDGDRRGKVKEVLVLFERMEG